jgi:hypothetical protein
MAHQRNPFRRVPAALCAGLLLAAPALAQEASDARTRHFYVAAYAGGAHLDVTKLTGIAASSGYGTVGASFGVRLAEGLFVEIGHRRIGDGEDHEKFELGRHTYFKLDSGHLGPVWLLPLGENAEFAASAGIHTWRYRFIERTVGIGPFTETIRRDSSAGAYGRLGVNWRINPAMTLGGALSYLDVENTAAGTLDVRFAYKF